MSNTIIHYNLIWGDITDDKDFKKNVVNYLSNHPKLKKDKNVFYLKDSILSNPIIKLGSTALYIGGNNWWNLAPGETLAQRFNGHKIPMYLQSGSSGDARLFYEQAIPEVLEILINRIEENARKIPLIDKNHILKKKMEKISNDFK